MICKVRKKGTKLPHNVWYWLWYNGRKLVCSLHCLAWKLLYHRKKLYVDMAETLGILVRAPAE